MAARTTVEWISGDLVATGLRFAVVVARFNELVTDRMADGAVDTLLRAGADPGQVTVYRVPGSWEIPQAASKILDTKEVDALIALGCLIRGETAHFELIAGEVTRSLARLGVESGIPVAFGVLTTDTMAQALDRAGGKAGNKGAEAALAAVELARLHRRIAAGR